MIIREININDKKEFNSKATHPLQSWEWGEFRKKTGVKVIRKGVFEGKKLITSIQVTIHPIPKTSFTVGYFPKGPMPDETQLRVLKKIGQENNCLFIKLEPDVGSKVNEGPKVQAFSTIDEFLLKRGCKKGRPMFAKHTFLMDIAKSETELLEKMHSKTRYNIRLAEKKGVRAVVDNSEASFKWFLGLLFEKTVTRQGFYAHTPEYYKQLWSVLAPAGIAHLVRASFGEKVLSVFMVFVFGQKIYYPYGASTREYKELMAPNLTMWELIRFGKRQGCKTLDMWGALGKNPDPKDPWYGFHRFKEGYGGDLVEFMGSYDYVLNNKLYPIYRKVEAGRWSWLRSKAAIRRLPTTIGSWTKWGKSVKTKTEKAIDTAASLFE